EHLAIDRRDRHVKPGIVPSAGTVVPDGPNLGAVGCSIGNGEQVALRSSPEAGTRDVHEVPGRWKDGYGLRIVVTVGGTIVRGDPDLGTTGFVVGHGAVVVLTGFSAHTPGDEQRRPLARL